MFAVALGMAVLVAGLSRVDAQEGRGAPTRPARRPPSTRQGAADLEKLAADVVRSMTQYRESLERLRAVYDEQLRAASAALEERRGLHAQGVLDEIHVREAEQAWREASDRVEEVNAWIAEADRIIGEASFHEQLARLPPLAPNAYEASATLIRFNGMARWSLADLPRLERIFAGRFGRGLPISAVGQTSVHERIGFDHRNAADVALHPDSPEGRWLMDYLRGAGIPFIGVRSAMPGASTGAHIHVGPPSPRLLGR